MPLTFRYATPFFDRHAKAFKRAALIQGALLCAIHDRWSYDAHCTLLVATIAYWMIILLIMVRHERRLTRLDFLLLNWGFPLLLPLIILAVQTAILHKR